MFPPLPFPAGTPRIPVPAFAEPTLHSSYILHYRKYPQSVVPLPDLTDISGKGYSKYPGMPDLPHPAHSTVSHNLTMSDNP